LKHIIKSFLCGTIVDVAKALGPDATILLLATRLKSVLDAV
jgi:hypothetical protein